MDPLARLTALFERFPGIGPRQAERFVQFLLRSPAVRAELGDALHTLGNTTRRCELCQRHVGGKTSQCSLCADTKRNSGQLAIVASDTDVAALEKSGGYNGLYFVLGGTISLASEQLNGLRMRELHARTSSTYSVQEIILAFPANPEGDATSVRIREEILATHPEMRITTLGRGLSTGSELEYADPETLRNALASRK